MILDTREYVSVLKELVESGKETSMIVWGGSMVPFLGSGRDRIYFAAPDGPLRRGDMVFYQRESGRYVMHRIQRVRPEGLYLVGDAQTAVEGPLAPERVFARVFAVDRKGKRLTEKSLLWRFFAGPWLWLRPLRRRILGAYGWFRGRIGGKQNENNR